jgi:hypothetical protein
VKSIYVDMINGHTVFSKKIFMEVVGANKKKIFMCFFTQIGTKDNITKCDWNGCKKCAICDSEESINHLFICMSLCLSYLQSRSFYF